jgi:hypothetical protein
MTNQLGPHNCRLQQTPVASRLSAAESAIRIQTNSRGEEEGEKAVQEKRESGLIDATRDIC